MSLTRTLTTAATGLGIAAAAALAWMVFGASPDFADMSDAQQQEVLDAHVAVWTPRMKQFPDRTATLSARAEHDYVHVVTTLDPDRLPFVVFSLKHQPELFRQTGCQSADAVYALKRGYAVRRQSVTITGETLADFVATTESCAPPFGGEIAYRDMAAPLQHDYRKAAAKVLAQEAESSRRMDSATAKASATQHAISITMLFDVAMTAKARRKLAPRLTNEAICPDGLSQTLTDRGIAVTWVWKDLKGRHVTKNVCAVTDPQSAS